MLGLAEYVAAGAALKALGQRIEAKQKAKLEDITNKQQAIKIATDYSEEYQTEYEGLLYEGLDEVADTAATYHLNRLNSDISPSDIAKKVTLLQIGDEYYGLTLAKRLWVTQRQLKRRIVQSAQTGIHNLNKVYTNPVPFGAQNNVNKRLMLGYMVKVEQEVAKEVARQTNYHLLRWTLSHRHKQEDICDQYATYVDDKVVEYLNTNNLDDDPSGLYFIDDVPDPPHPNCQCELHIFAPGLAKPKRLRRTAIKLRKIIRKILRRG